MKGFVNTDVLLRAILNKEKGILPKGSVLTHITAAKIPTYPKLLFFTDPAVLPFPTHEQRIEQIKYVANFCHAFNIEQPKFHSFTVRRNQMVNIFHTQRAISN